MLNLAVDEQAETVEIDTAGVPRDVEFDKLSPVALELVDNDPSGRIGFERSRVRVAIAQDAPLVDRLRGR